MKIKQRSRKQPRVEILPLIDVVFLLLIFFIYAMLSMAVHRGLDLDLPESNSAEISQVETISISVTKNNGELSELLVLVNEKRVGLSVLGEYLQNMDVNEDESQAQVFADATISYQELFLVLDQVKAGGIHSISLQARRGKD